jgi:hypothetical protein
MRYILIILAFVSLSLTTLSEVKEFSPVKVLVDTDRGVVLREPTQLDYDHFKDAFKLDKPKSLKDLILGRRSCGG